MEDLNRIIREREFLKDLPPDYIDLLQGCASNVRYDPGEFIFREGDEANGFYIVRHGQVAMLQPVAGRGVLQVDTAMEEDVLGFSWMLPPYEAYFDARATTLVRALLFDAACLRAKLESDPRFGYEMMKRFTQVILHRLQGARMQLMDVYGTDR